MTEMYCMWLRVYKGNFSLLWTMHLHKCFWSPWEGILWKIAVSQEGASFRVESDFRLRSLRGRPPVILRIWNIHLFLTYRWIVLQFINLKPSFCLSCKNTIWCVRCISLVYEISVREPRPSWRASSSLTFGFAATLSSSSCPKLIAMQSSVAS